MKFLEDIAVGEPTSLGSHTFTADDIKRFARRYDPQPFHLDEAAAARSHFGALCASGWHTAATWMRLMVEHQVREAAAQRARGEAVADLGPSPGFREMKWLKPVYVGDTIKYSTEIIDKRVSNSRPGWGIITIRNTGVNQKGEPVISFISVVFLQSRATSAFTRVFDAPGANRGNQPKP
jgi:acyl dehydratase